MQIRSVPLPCSDTFVAVAVCGFNYFVKCSFSLPPFQSICSRLKVVLGPSQQHFGSWVKKPAILKVGLEERW